MTIRRVFSCLVLAFLVAVYATGAESPVNNPFVTAVVETGLFEIAAGELAQANTSNAAVHTFGYLMITNHEELARELEPIAHKMNIEVPRSMGTANQQMLDQLKALKGAAFDKAYLAHMVQGHEQAVQLFDKERKSSPPNDLTRWAARTVPVIREHLRLAKELQASLK